jgi:hypothetical protein
MNAGERAISSSESYLVTSLIARILGLGAKKKTKEKFIVFLEKEINY